MRRFTSSKSVWKGTGTPSTRTRLKRKPTTLRYVCPSNASSSVPRGTRGRSSSGATRQFSIASHRHSAVRKTRGSFIGVNGCSCVVASVRSCDMPVSRAALALLATITTVVPRAPGAQVYAKGDLLAVHDQFQLGNGLDQCEGDQLRSQRRAFAGRVQGAVSAAY